MDLSVNNDSMLSPLQTGTALRTLFGLSRGPVRVPLADSIDEGNTI